MSFEEKLEPLGRWIFDKFMIPMVLVLAVVLVGVVIYAPFGFYQMYQRQQTMMQQCLADGHKEYECVGILAGRRR